MRRWFPPILWSALVLGASTDLFSAAHTGSVLDTLSRALLGHPLPQPIFDPLHFAIRKAAHLTEYGILAFLWFRAIRNDAPLRWTWRWALTAVAIAALVATTDEVHQSFVPSRGSSPYDVMLDIAGATIAVSAIRARMLLSLSP